MTSFVQIALPVPLRDTFTYSYVAGEEAPLLGARVEVKFGNRALIGVVVGHPHSVDFDPSKIKNIETKIDEHALVPKALLELCNWGASYYQHPLGEVISAALPKRYREGKAVEIDEMIQLTREGLGLDSSSLKRAKKQQEIHAYLLENAFLQDHELSLLGFSKSALKELIQKGLAEKIEAFPPANTESILKEAPKELNSEQRAALEAINYHQFQTNLIHGATGSGKTEVYLQIIARVLQSGKQALVLIPEIGLTHQTLSRFRARFHVSIAELHSNVAETERAKNWEAAKAGIAKIVLGTRLASLTPFKDLGVIIVDEEHDHSYKQQDGFKYSARDISIYRAHQLSIPIVLGTATPSLESLNNALTGKYQHIRLTKRAGNAIQPKIIKVDLRKKNLFSGLTEYALDTLKETVAANEQAMVFVNRRGYASALVCHHCGWSSDCNSCDARMTLHTTPYHLRCHYCDKTARVPLKCPNCSNEELITAGQGTEQLEALLQERFSTTPIIRIDRDSTRTKNAMEKKLSIGQEEKACIYVGTQMLAKGHHLPYLTTVVIVDADQGLLSPDFRGLEIMGQLLIQVAGRAGREQKQGLVLLQSHRTEHPQLNELITEGYETFAKSLLIERQNSQLPPFWHIAAFKAESKRPENCIQFLKQVRSILLQHSRQKPIQVLGPLPASIEKINDRFRFSLQLKSSSRQALQTLLNASQNEIDQLALSKRTRWSLEVDCLNPI